MKTQTSNSFKCILGASALSLALLGCEKSDRSFSILADEQQFAQSAEAVQVPAKIDILWVIDNSGSMATSQTQLTENFNRFIQRFKALKYDYRIAVTVSDAWTARFNGNNSLRRVRDGVGTTHSNVFVIDNKTPNLEQAFVTNALQGINGNGDERVFQSFEEVLNSPLNADFRRPDAFLAIISVSDEDDFSANTSAFLNNSYTDSRLIPVSYYKNFLDQKFGAPNYSFNTISILDEACRAQVATPTFSGRIVGVRYNQLADATGGVKASLCGNFGDQLQLISDTIVQNKLSFQFQLNREPVKASIVVRVDGTIIREDEVTGWTYDAANRIVKFSPQAVPAAGAQVSITFDPLNPKN